jgi:N-acetylmuramoyl-L-alanine amidase
VANNTKESDNNLAVALKLRDKLVQAGAKVLMTRDSDRTVGSEGLSLSEELEARVTIAEKTMLIYSLVYILMTIQIAVLKVL